MAHPIDAPELPSAVEPDLGPLAWVLEELRKSLDSANKALKRFVRDAELARGSDIAALDASQLRIARQQLHQAVGALEMVGQEVPARMLRAMEALAQRFVQKPEVCSDAAASKLEHASFALTDYLDGLLKGKPDSSVALFPQYRDVLALLGEDRIHPADLWTQPWRWPVVPLPAGSHPLGYDSPARGRMDGYVLNVVKSGHAPSALAMRDLCVGFSLAQKSPQPRVFWAVSAAFFEAVGLKLCAADVHVKRAASRVLLQARTLVRGEPDVSERLALDLLFFCAQAQPGADQEAPVLRAVRQAFGLTQAQAVDYEREQFGRFDPALLAQARKRIASAAETWSALSGGDAQRVKLAQDQFSLVCDSIVKLHPDSAPLAQALVQAMDAVVRAAGLPTAPLAMEVATAVLYLEAAYDDTDPAEADVTQRSLRLADRLQQVLAGAPSQPLDGWMEDLYRRVSDRQTMGSVVDELRSSLGEIESGLDSFFRQPQDKTPLVAVPGKLSQMRGVFSVLGLDQAALAALRMRDSVEQCLVDQLDTTNARPAVFDRLGNSLGAMGFMIDMLSYQRELAKKLFVYDEEAGELKALMGRSKPAPEPQHVGASAEAFMADPPLAEVSTPALVSAPAEPLPSAPTALADADVAVPSGPPVLVAVVPAQPAVPSPVAANEEADEDDAELLDIFLEEARDVVRTGLQAVTDLRAFAADLPQQTSLRRAFHTLKGSARMVGLGEFGEAAWAMEQVLNAWLPLQKPASDGLVGLSEQALQAFDQWVEAIAQGQSSTWSAQPFRDSADALRLHEQWLPLAAGPQAQVPAAGVPAPLPEPEKEPEPEPLWAPEPTALPERAPDEAAVAPEDIELAPESRLPNFAATEFSLAWVEEAPGSAPVSPAPESPLTAFEPTDFSLVWEEPAAAPASEASLATDLPELAPSAEASADAELRPAPEQEPDLEGLLELDWPDLAAPAEVTSPASALPDPESAPPLLEPAAAEAMEDVQNKEQPAPESQGLEVEMATDFGMSLADFGFDDPEAPAMADSASPADTEPEGGVDTVPLAPAGEVAEPAWPEDLDLDLDFGPMSGLPEQPSAPAELAPVVEPQTQAVSETQAEPAFDAEVGYEEAWTAPAQPAVSEDLPEDAQAEDPVKIIGGLRLNIPLYNVYLNEADEWSRRLATELNEWALQPLAVSLDTASALAHSLAGSSATVGFMGLSELARALEHALDHVQLGAHLDAAQVQLLLDVCDDIRRLLHQFAAGFLKQPDPRHIPALHALLALPVSDTGLGGLDDADAANTSALRERPETPPELEQEPEPFTVADLAPLEPAPAAPVPLWQDDDIEVKDAPDVDLFPIFEEEALELLPQLSAAMRQWAARPGQASARGEILRVLHTLKGSARLAGAMRLGEMTHRLESAVEQVLPESATPVQIEPLLARLDAIGADFDQLRASGQDLLRLPEALPVPAAPPAPATAEPLTLQNKELPSPVLQGLEAELSAQASAPAATHPVAAPAPLVAMPPRKAAGQTIRVRAQLLDRMVNQAGEVMTSRTRLESRLGQMQAALGELTGNLDRLRGQLREMELQSESQLQSRLAQSKDTAQAFDPLEFDRFTRVQELTRMMAESVHDVATLQRTLQQTAAGVEDDLILQARQTRELQRDLLRARMVEFESIAERLYGVVRQAAKDAGKQVTLDIEGGAIEMDRGVLERMATAFEHLLRNAVGHGIEAPEQRLAAGKPAAGVIRIHLQQLANDVVVTFADDGGGLDLPRIRAKALALGLVQPEQTLGDDDVAQLIFSAGLSTATEVSGLAGRGIGMDVVRSEVHALGGRIEVASKAGQGTEFRLLLPLTTAVSQVVLLRLGDATVGVPANLVELVRRVPAATLGQAYAQGVFDYNGQPLPFFWAGALLQLSAHSSEPPGKTVSVAVFRSAGRLVALHVDEVLGNQEVVVKNLGPQLARLPGLAGMSLLASGAVVLIYNPVALVATYGEQARAAQHAAVTAPDVGEAPPTAANSPAPAPQVPLVLVVDDSITVRRVTQRLLKREGFRVALANDGLHALEVLQQEKPAVVLTDIEMPRMDGFDLVRNIRADAQLAGLPIIMITSRIAEKHREYARELKVDHYLGKPYPEDVLIELVRGYCQAAAPLTTA